MCIKDAGYEGELIARKVYAVLPDETAEKRNLIRIVDESGQDYLYAPYRFVPIDVPEQAQALFTMAPA
jgi:hypothetical protein